MIKNFEYLDHRMEIYFSEKESNYLIYKDGQFLLKGKGYPGIEFRTNGCFNDAKEAVHSLITKEKLKKRLGWLSAFNFLK
jgi:hypothetical protein